MWVVTLYCPHSDIRCLGLRPSQDATAAEEIFSEAGSSCAPSCAESMKVQGKSRATKGYKADKLAETVQLRLKAQGLDAASLSV